MPRGRPYWETDIPWTAVAGAVEARWFPRAGRLQLHRTFIGTDGQRRSGSVVTLTVDAFATSPEGRRLLADFLGEADALAAADPLVESARDAGVQ